MVARSVIREGLIAGAIGAVSVAVWFLLVDLISGRPMSTPDVLGTALLDVFGPRGGEGSFAHIVTYTIFHFAVFFVVGILISLVVHRAEEQPAILALGIVLFIIIEMGFYGLTAILSNSGALGTLAWYQVGAANLLAAVLMGFYMYKKHPLLRQEFEQALGGNDE